MALRTNSEVSARFCQKFKLFNQNEINFHSFLFRLFVYNPCQNSFVAANSRLAASNKNKRVLHIYKNQMVSNQTIAVTTMLFYGVDYGFEEI